ncbi:MAG: glycosyltransferase [Methylacidiphilales bacterium]|nr:glycosyltransferase [Candidatus Methylacidiphilales bacterium]MDW8348924.1 glycosyltransferase [Verrucomicrobiae bacterium]
MSSSSQRITCQAKFFYKHDQKFYAQGVTYGPFKPRSEGAPHLPNPKEVERDFSLMCDLGINLIRLYHVPPRWLMDKAAEHQIYVLITIPWVKRVLFLDDKKTLQQTRHNVSEAARMHRDHPALMGFFVDNEIPPDLVRWYGARKVEKYLDQLVAIIKDIDPAALVTYANFPPTEYLLPANVDFYSYNVYLHRISDLKNYLSRLHNLAGEKPVLLSEFGMDTLRHSEEEQAQLLVDHIKTVFQSGLAGTIIFSWTDEWFTDGVEINDWAFGITRKDRSPKLAYSALKPYLSEPHRPLYQRFPLSKTPKVSVVVCSYNGARTLRDCLTSLQRLHYPDYEVIFVDDGSTDHSQEIVKDFPNVINIYQKNKGLSVARNVGIERAQGSIVAFTDSDCMADPDWLYFLVLAFDNGKYAAVGGPNLSPPAANWVQATVAAAPGSPSHVLLTDTEAEHVPGCNMAFQKSVLQEVNGFDPEYRKAGDDVDICWRIMQRGYKIGFSPTAIVWHYRRFTVEAYFKQQKGYGEAEALLRFKHLNHFADTGSAIWHGRVYSQVRLDPIWHRPVIYHGVWGTGFFQCIYPQQESPWSYLLSSIEWLGLTLFIFLLSIPLEFLRIMPLVMFGLTLIVGLSYILRARMEPKYDIVLARLLLLYLALAQPWARGWARYFTWLKGKNTPDNVLKKKEEEPHPTATFLNSHHLRFWSDKGLDRCHLLSAITQLLESEEWKYAIDTGWNDWDIHIFASRWWNIRLRSMTEIYPHGKRLTRIHNHLHATTFSRLVNGILFTFLLTFFFVGFHIWPWLFAITLLSLAGLFLHGLAIRRRVADLVQVAATHAGLVWVNTQNKQ